MKLATYDVGALQSLKITSPNVKGFSDTETKKI